jgi:hypothetical protein
MKITPALKSRRREKGALVSGMGKGSENSLSAEARFPRFALDKTPAQQFLGRSDDTGDRQKPVRLYWKECFSAGGPIDHAENNPCGTTEQGEKRDLF